MELEELHLRMTKIMRAFDRHNSEHIEDAIQEGVIAVWKGIQAGKSYTDAYMLNKATQAAKAHLFDAPRGRRHATGHPGGNSFTLVQKDSVAKAEKVHAYVKEYQELHGAPPLPAQIAREVGVTPQFAKKYMYVTPAAVGGRSCDQLPPVLSLSWWEEKREGSTDAEVNSLGTVPSAEEDAVGDMSFRQFFHYTTPRRAQLIYFYHVEGYTQQELASMYGIAQMTVSRDIANGLRDIREALSAM